jgi:hypothetical protein
MSRKKTDRRTDTHEPRSTPESVTDLEKTELDDEAVSKAVTAEDGTKSVLPGPPIPPDVQAKIKDETDSGDISGRRGPRSKKPKTKGVSEMVDSSQIKEHMEVVGSDGEHVGTVDRCEGADIIKLTKNDPAADGKHHYIPMAWVNRVDQQVHLAHPGSEARLHWG